jgi:hypothetical protein
LVSVGKIYLPSGVTKMSFNSDDFQSYAVTISNDFAQTYVYNAGADSFATVATAAYFNDLVYRVATGDKLLVKTETSGLSFSGTFLNDGTNVSVNWDNTLRFEARMDDISAASTVFFGATPAGVITQVYGTQWSAITVASSVITFSIGSTAITGGVLTVPTSGAAGSLYSATPTALNVPAGTSAVKAVSDGGGTTTAIMTLGFKIICPAQI